MVFTSLDIAVFLGALVLVMAFGLWAARRERTSEDYFLAGRSVRWWGVAASIYGTNVSANHVVGMLGIGYTVGFAQSHFELGAIAGLMLLCYGFLPVYRRLNVYTLSEYLAQRYDERSRVLYALAMLVIMVLVHMVQGFYIGSRSMNLIVRDSPLELGYTWGVIALAVVATVYTVLGGLKAVIWTDVLQSILLLAAGLIVAALTFSQSEIGGWSGMRALDAAAAADEQKMHLYLPSDHPDLPWTGVLTGLMCLHFFYWSTNQFIAQRALAARSDAEAQLGIVAAGFFKLLIPFFAIGTGVASYYLFNELGIEKPDSDAAFPELARLVVPVGYGIVGLIAAGVIGAILSSVDSMMNSAATIVTMDIYRRYLKRDAEERELVLVGRISVVVFIVIAALIAIFVIDPESKESFFLVIVNQQSHIAPGLVVTFALGMFWRRATGTGAFVTLLVCPAISVGLGWSYNNWLHTLPGVEETFGAALNTFHRVVVTVLLGGLLHAGVSLVTRHDPQKAQLVWSGTNGAGSSGVGGLLAQIALSLALYVTLAGLMVAGLIAPLLAASIGAAWTWLLFARRAWLAQATATDGAQASASPLALIGDDRFWAGLLCGLAVFMMYYYY